MIMMEEFMGRAEFISSGATYAAHVLRARYVEFSTSGAGTATLPDATKLIPGGPYFYFTNYSTGMWKIVNQGGFAVTSISTGQSAIILLTESGSVNGAWRSVTHTRGTYSTEGLLDGWLIGGDSSAVANRKYESDTSVWSSGTNCPVARTDSGAFSIRDSVYLGGVAGGGSSDVYQWDKAAWTLVAAAPWNPIDCAAFTLKDLALGYLLGGLPNSTLNVAMYDASSDTWVSKVDMPSNRSKFTALGGKENSAHVFSGNPDTAPSYHYDAQDDAYRTITFYPNSTRESISGFGERDSRALIVGGRTFTPDDWHDDVSEWDPNTAAWTTKTAHPTERYDGAAWDMNKIGYYGGGQDNADTQVDTVTRYEDDTWTSDTVLPAVESGILNHGSALT